MELYQGFNLQQAQGFQANTAATGQALQNVQNLQERLSGFYKNSMQTYGEAKINEAVDRAAKDDAEGKPFHQESIHTLYGQAYNDSRKATYASQIEMNLDETNTQLQMDYRNDPDGYRNAVKNYYEGLSEDAPTPELKGTVKIYGRKLMNATYGSLVLEKKKQDDKTALEIYNQNTDIMLGKSVNAQVSGDTATAELLKTGHISKLTALKDDGVIGEDQYLEELRNLGQRFDSSVQLSTLDKLIEGGDLNQAKSLVDNFDKSIPEIYSPEEHQKLSNSLNSKYNSAVKLVKAQQKEVKTQVETGVKEATELFKNNKQPEQLIPDNVLSLASLKVQRDYKIAQSAYNWVSTKFNSLSLEEQEYTHALLSGKNPVKGIADLEVQKMAKKIIDNRLKGWKSDPINQGVEEGINPPTKPLTIQNADIIPNIIATRVDHQKKNKAIAGNYASDFLLTKTEAEGLKNYFDSDVPSTEKLELLTQLFMNGPEVGSKLIKQFDNGNMNSLAFAGSMLLSGQKESARLSLMGSKLKINIPQDIKTTITDSIAGVYTNFSANKYNQVNQGIQDYLKAMSKETGEDLLSVGPGDIKDIVKTIVGERIEYNGKAILLPLGKSKNQFGKWVENIKIPDTYDIDDDTREILEEEVQSMEDFFGKTNKYKLYNAGGGKYAIYDTVTGGGSFLADNSGKPIILEYED
jgi:hypothetical protein